MTPAIRALAATILFSIVGISSLFFHDTVSQFTLPNALFYTVLTINTYFSVRFYSAWTPTSIIQTAIDLALMVAYIALGLSIGTPLAFSFFALIVFAIAPVKYANLLGKTPYNATLRKKIFIDLLGTALCVVVLGLTRTSVALPAAWFGAGLFTLANVYLLCIRPMYRHVK